MPRQPGDVAQAIAAEVFGFADLRLEQAAPITALIEGRDCLVVMPSAAGKSAIYQIAALARSGPAVIVSPLVALQRDQARALHAHGLAAIPVNSPRRRSRWWRWTKRTASRPGGMTSARPGAAASSPGRSG